MRVPCSPWLVHWTVQKRDTCLKFFVSSVFWFWNLCCSPLSWCPNAFYPVPDLFPRVSSLLEVSFWSQWKQTANQILSRGGITKQNNIFLNKLRKVTGLGRIPRWEIISSSNPTSGCSKQTRPRRLTKAANVLPSCLLKKHVKYAFVLSCLDSFLNALFWRYPQTHNEQVSKMPSATRTVCLSLVCCFDPGSLTLRP